MNRIRKRSEFLEIKRSVHRIHLPYLIAQWDFGTSNVLETPDSKGVHFGLVVTKKIGNAVKRNRIKRRLRSAIHDVFYDISNSVRLVLVARSRVYDMPFSDIISGFETVKARILSHNPLDFLNKI